MKEAANKICEPIKNTIYRFKKDGGKGTGELWRVAEPMLYNLYSDLSDEERKERIVVLIEQTIKEMYMSDYLKEKKNKRKKKSITPKLS